MMDNALKDANALSNIVITESIYIHRCFGPGLLESAYEAMLYMRLRKRGLLVERQVSIPIYFEGEKLELGFIADLIVNKILLIELKSVKNLAPVHRKQILTYLRVTGIKLGLLINFGEALLKDGIARVINSKSTSIQASEQLSGPA